MQRMSHDKTDIIMKMDGWSLSWEGEIYNSIHTHKTTTQDLALLTIIFVTPNRLMDINDLINDWMVTL